VRSKVAYRKVLMATKYKKKSSKTKHAIPPAKPRAGLHRLLAELFRAHWKSVEAELSKGVDFPKNRADCFFGRSSSQRLRMARSYYTLARANAFANSTLDDILHLSEPWLSTLYMQIDSEWLQGRDIRKTIKELVAAEYVAVSMMSPDPFKRPIEEITSICPLPNESVLYGDVYEITAAGFSVGSYLRVSKSVAEPFLETERAGVMRGIEKEFFANAASDGHAIGDWQINFRELDDGRLIEADIWEVPEEYRVS
jgi:hypothetical protein